MKRELICIGCPMGCQLTAEVENGVVTSVSGNTCPRGREFAVSEMTAPKRTICSTVRTAFADAPVLPVRVSADIPKDRIFDVMDAIRTVTRANIVGADLNELAPTLDTTGVSTATACKVLRELLIALDKGWPGFQV